MFTVTSINLCIFHTKTITQIKVAEHRERIQKRTSPYPSPSHSPPSYYISPKQQQQRPHIHHQTSSSSTRAIPIIDPSNMTPVSVPMQQQQQQYTMKSNNTNTSPSMAQWVAYKNSTSNSPTSSNSSISSLSSTTSSSTSNNNTLSNNFNHQNSIHHYNNYYYGNSSNCSPVNYNHYHQAQVQQPQMMPIVARAIPIIDPSTRQVYRQQQHVAATNIPPPGFYNVSVC